MSVVLSPLMRQYVAIKEQYRDTLLLFQVGDFYELFFEDAQNAAHYLGITLTKRGMIGNDPIPLCGVPVHMVDHYLQKLVKGGHKVALCKQLSEPVPGKIVERAVTQVITPGTIIDAPLMQDINSQYLVAIADSNQTRALVMCEVISGSVSVTTFERTNKQLLEDELARICPREILISDSKPDAALISLLKTRGYVVSVLDTMYWKEYLEKAQSEFQSIASHHPLVINSAAAQEALILMYACILRNQPHALQFLQNIEWYVPQNFLQLDETTQRNLEIVEPLLNHAESLTLFKVLNECVTAMGSRALKSWLLRPLINKEQIEQRHRWVRLFKENPRICLLVRSLLKEIGDLERILGRIALNKSSAHDYRNLMHALEKVPQIHQMISRLSDDSLLGIAFNAIEACATVCNFLSVALNQDETKDWIIKEGFNQELDRLRDLVANGSDAILRFEQEEQSRTGINSLKIRDHQSHGYGIEVTKTNLHLVPSDYIRVQSLVNKDRFTTSALKDLEFALRQSHIQSADLEKQLFNELTQHIVHHLADFRSIALWLTKVDILTTFGYLAYQRGYVQPHVVNERVVQVNKGKHPVVAEVLKHDFKPNSVFLNDDQRLLVITGPNMGGKSTYLRQIALQLIMCQAGSFIPAEDAILMIVDRIFTRIGASDNVARGESTFYVEMKEAAMICASATINSLVILDEIGRGTSTYDGLALAQAILEYMYEDRQSRCLFATHYHELTELAHHLPAVKNYHAASLSDGEKVVLLHEIWPGVAEGSFGIAVAQMAQMPDKIINRARVLKSHYESVR